MLGIQLFSWFLKRTKYLRSISKTIVTRYFTVSKHFNRIIYFLNKLNLIVKSLQDFLLVLFSKLRRAISTCVLALMEQITRVNFVLMNVLPLHSRAHYRTLRHKTKFVITFQFLINLWQFQLKFCGFCSALTVTLFRVVWLQYFTYTCWCLTMRCSKIKCAWRFEIEEGIFLQWNCFILSPAVSRKYFHKAATLLKISYKTSTTKDLQWATILEPQLTMGLGHVAGL